MFSEPVDVARTALAKIAVDLSGLRLEEPVLSKRNLVGLVSNSVLLTLAVLGAFVPRNSAAQTSHTLWLCIATVCLTVYVSISAIGPVGLRYRISFDPVLWSLAAIWLTNLVARLRGGIHPSSTVGYPE